MLYITQIYVTIPPPHQQGVPYVSFGYGPGSSPWGPGGIGGSIGDDFGSDLGFIDDIKFGGPILPRLDFSVGFPGFSVPIPRVSVPDLAQPDIVIPKETGFFKPTARTLDIPLPPTTPGAVEASQKVITKGARGWIFAGIEYLSEAAARVASQGKAHLLATNMILGPVRLPEWGPSIPTVMQEGGSMDLGDLLGQLGSAFIQAKFTPPAGAPPYGFPEYQGGAGIPTSSTPVLTPVGVIDSAQAALCPPRRRRRRKRLATASDIRDLAALKDTIGPSMTKTWIATHPS